MEKLKCKIVDLTGKY